MAVPLRPVLSTPREPSLIPGVLIIAGGRGVLLEGPSGAGKSDAAVALLDRGHTLVADDAVRLHRDGDRLLGGCPEDGRGLLHLRDLGVIEVTRLYPGAFRPWAEIGLCLRLQPEPGASEAEGLLQGRRDDRWLLGIRLPRITLTDSAQRPLAPLIEAAAGQPDRPAEPAGTASRGTG